MKIYSDDAISRTELDVTVGQQIGVMGDKIDAIDIKQAKQIVMLRWAVGLSFVLNALLTIALHLA